MSNGGAVGETGRSARGMPTGPLAVMAVLLASSLLMWGSLTEGHDWGDDFASYIMQAASLSEGRTAEFLELNRFTIENSVAMLGPVAYPWGFPSLLAPIYSLFGLDLMALKCVGVVCFLIFLVVLWRLFAEEHAISWRLALICSFAFNANSLSIANQIISDLPFLLFSTLCLLLIQRSVRSGLAPRLVDQCQLGAAIAGAYVIRPNGLLLLVTLAVGQLVPWMRKSRSQNLAGPVAVAATGSWPSRAAVAHLTPYVVFVVLALIWVRWFPESGFARVSLFADMSRDTVREMLKVNATLPEQFFLGVPYRHGVYIASVLLAIVGASLRYKNDHFLIGYFAVTLLVLIAFPYPQGIRYVLPILPIYISFVLTGLEVCCRGTPGPGRTFRRAIVGTLVIGVLISMARESVQVCSRNLGKNRQVAEGPFTEPAREMFSFIVDRTEPASVIAFFKPRALRMLTGHRSATFNDPEDLRLPNYVSLYRVQFPPQIPRDHVLALQKQGRATSVFKNEDFEVFRLSPGDRPESGAAK